MAKKKVKISSKLCRNLNHWRLIPQESNHFFFIYIELIWRFNHSAENLEDVYIS